MVKIFLSILFAFFFPLFASARWCEAKYKWISIREAPSAFTTFILKNGMIYPGGEQDPDPLKNVDTKTFKVAISENEVCERKFYQRSYWGKDKNHIFFGDTVLNQADIATFEPLSAQIAKDKKHVYCWDFHFGGFSGDLNREADPLTFKTLTAPGDESNSQFWYYRDASRIFSKWCTSVQGAEAQSFEMVKNPSTKFDAKDSKRKYSLGYAVD